MASVKLTRDLIRTIEPTDKTLELYDSECAGLLLRVQPSGRMVYAVRYARGKQWTIGRADTLPPSEARDAARAIIADYNSRGIDPAAERRKVKVPALSVYVRDTYGPWLREHRKGAEATLAMLDKAFGPDFGKVPLDEINAFAVEKWRAQSLKSGMKASSVNRYMNAFGAALTRAVDWGIIATHPLRGRVKPLKVDSAPKTRHLSADEESRLRAALAARDEKMATERASANAWRAVRGYDPLPDLTGCYGDHLTPAVLVSINTGLRRSELFGLKWVDVDLANGMLTVAGDRAKSGHTRYVPLNAEALAILKSWKKQIAGELVFPGPAGTALTNATKAWNTVLEDATTSDFRWHDLRHTFASNLVMAGVDLNTVRELLGHSDMKMTLRYAHLAPHVKADAVARLDRRAV